MSVPQSVLDNTPFCTVTQGVKIQVHPQFSHEHSKPEASLFVYYYTIRISNESKETIQVVSRHWIITDALSREEIVVGEGVVGKQPILKPGESFTYTSSCPLRTPTGVMRGSFQVVMSQTKKFDATISDFFLRDLSLLN